ncbi:hypothetical protein GALMADRAFT_221657 [Galerina marginata CBS 339.88]|uniref:Uncharacterized protein n=1 Tax=Galerina marginata (strain CBS 339.88) TaxID=685588 RepID=A0A067TF44_GALM3|nr:hypothetical protein GALMADRAFT_221657 [Galerina marginata CBS 339.88]
MSILSTSTNSTQPKISMVIPTLYFKGSLFQTSKNYIWKQLKKHLKNVTTFFAQVMNLSVLNHFGRSANHRRSLVLSCSAYPSKMSIFSPFSARLRVLNISKSTMPGLTVIGSWSNF